MCIYWPWRTIFTLANLTCEWQTPVASSPFCLTKGAMIILSYKYTYFNIPSSFYPILRHVTNIRPFEVKTSHTSCPPMRERHREKLGLGQSPWSFFHIHLQCLAAPQRHSIAWHDSRRERIVRATETEREIGLNKNVEGDEEDNENLSLESCFYRIKLLLI